MRVFQHYNMLELATHPEGQNQLFANIMPILDRNEGIAAAMGIGTLAASDGTQISIQQGDASLSLLSGMPIQDQSTQQLAASTQMQERIQGKNSSTVPKQQEAPQFACSSRAESFFERPDHQAKIQSFSKGADAHTQLCFMDDPDCSQPSCPYVHIRLRAPDGSYLHVNYLWQYSLPAAESDEIELLQGEAKRKYSTTEDGWIDFHHADMESIEKAYCDRASSLYIPNIPPEYHVYLSPHTYTLHYS